MTDQRNVQKDSEFRTSTIDIGAKSRRFLNFCPSQGGAAARSIAGVAGWFRRRVDHSEVVKCRTELVLPGQKTLKRDKFRFTLGGCGRIAGHSVAGAPIRPRSVRRLFYASA